MTNIIYISSDKYNACSNISVSVTAFTQLLTIFELHTQRYINFDKLHYNPFQLFLLFNKNKISNRLSTEIRISTKVRFPLFLFVFLSSEIAGLYS